VKVEATSEQAASAGLQRAAWSEKRRVVKRTMARNSKKDKEKRDQSAEGFEEVDEGSEGEGFGGGEGDGAMRQDADGHGSGGRSAGPSGGDGGVGDGGVGHGGTGHGGVGSQVRPGGSGEGRHDDGHSERDVEGQGERDAEGQGEGKREEREDEGWEDGAQSESAWSVDPGGQCEPMGDFPFGLIHHPRFPSAFRANFLLEPTFLQDES